MRILVTGATGFVGRHAIAALKERGAEIHAVARTRGSLDVEWHTIDLHRPDAVRVVLESVRPTHLLHLAWNAVPGQFWTTHENLRWLESSVRLVEGFIAAGGAHIVCAGSCAEYGPTADACDEVKTPLTPTTLYGAAKHALHVVAERLAHQHGASFAWGRIFHPYGPHEPPAKLVASAIRSFAAGHPFDSTSGEQIRDFVHVTDCAEAFARLAATDADGAFNIGSGIPMTVAEALRAIATVMDAQHLLRIGAIPHRAGDADVVYANTARLTALGWRPQIAFEDGIRTTAGWLRAASADTPEPSTGEVGG